MKTHRRFVSAAAPFFKRGDFHQVAFQQFLECSGLGLDARNEYTLVHLDFNRACPLLSVGACLKGFGLQRLALFRAYACPCQGPRFLKVATVTLHSFANECDNVVTYTQLVTNTRGVVAMSLS